MSKPADAPIQIEPLTKEEKGKQTRPEVDESKYPELPQKWKGRTKLFGDAIDKGFRYYRRRIGDKVYMLLRKGRHDVSLGSWNEEKESLLFHLYPYLGTYAGIPKPPPWVSPNATPQGRSYLGIPISRTAIIPRDYVPSINVIRYFQVIKNNGFPGDFSQFINDVVTHHMEDCHGIRLPVMIEEDMDFKREEECNVETTSPQRR